MAVKTIKLKKASLSELFQLIESYSYLGSPVFRGQSNAKWGVLPSLFRLDANSNKTSTNGKVKGKPEASIDFQSLNKFEIIEEENGYTNLEKVGVDNFLNYQIPHFPAFERNEFNDRTLAQHFEVATRLSNWSFDPFVALFFAVQKWDLEPKQDAAFYMILPQEYLTAKNYHLRQPGTIAAIQPHFMDAKLAVQKSVFILHDLDKEKNTFIPLDKYDFSVKIDGIKKERLVKIIIPHARREELYWKLRGFDVSQKTLFPGIEGIDADLFDFRRSSPLVADEVKLGVVSALDQKEVDTLELKVVVNEVAQHMAQGATAELIIESEMVEMVEMTEIADMTGVDVFDGLVEQAVEEGLSSQMVQEAAQARTVKKTEKEEQGEQAKIAKIANILGKSVEEKTEGTKKAVAAKKPAKVEKPEKPKKDGFFNKATKTKTTK